MPKNVTKGAAPRAGKPANKRAKPVCRQRNPDGGSAEGNGGLYTIKFEKKKALDVRGFDKELDKGGTGVQGLERDLGRAYRRYCKVVGVDASAEDIQGMYRHMVQLGKKVHKEVGVGIEYSEKRGYVFLLWRMFNYKLQIYSMPLEFLMMLEEQKSKIAGHMLQFCGWMVTRLGFTGWGSDNWMLEYSVDMVPQMAEEIAEEEPAAALTMIYDVNRYTGAGLAVQWLGKMKQALKKPDRGFVTSLNRKKLNFKEDHYRRWMIDGVALLSDPEYRCVQAMQWVGEFDEEYYENGEPVTVEKQFVVCWNSEDSVMSEYMDVINSHNSEYSSFSPMEWLQVDKNTRRGFKVSEWPHKLRDWLDRGLSLMDRDLKIYNKKLEKEGHE